MGREEIDAEADRQTAALIADIERLQPPPEPEPLT